MSTQEETTLKTTPRAPRKDEGLARWILRKDARTKDLNKSKRFDVSFWCRESITARCESELFPFYFASFSYSSICALIFLRLVVKNWAHKKSSSLSLHLAYMRERKKYRKSRTFPLTREQRYARISLKRTSTSSNDHLPKSFTSCVASSAILFVFILCALLWMKLFLGFHQGSKKQTKNFSGTSDFLHEDFWQKNRSKTQVLHFPHFFSLVLGRCFGKVCVVVTVSTTIILP